MYHEITRCRICGCADLIPIIDLGMQALTGVFPRSRDERITTGPLELVKCDERAGGCGERPGVRHLAEHPDRANLTY